MSERYLDAADLLSALHQAQSELAGGGIEGTRHTWHFPAGEFQLPFGLVFGRTGHALVWSGPETRLVFRTEERGRKLALSLTGHQVVLEGLSLEAACVEELQVLRIEAVERILLQDVELAGLEADRVVGVSARAPHIEVLDCGLERLFAGASATGLELHAGESLRFERVHVRELRAPELLAFDAGAPELTARDIRINGLSASESSLGLRAQAGRRAQLSDIALGELRARRVRGILLDAPDGEVQGVSSEGLDGDEETEPLVLGPDTHVSLGGLAVVRHFKADALEEQLSAAAGELNEAVSGSEYTWVLPAGDYDFDHGWALGADGVSLRLLGPRGGGSARWRFGREAALDGDLTALAMIGDRLVLDGLVLVARCSGQLTALDLNATGEASVDDLQLRELQAAGLTGIAIAAPRLGLTDVRISQAQATGGDGVGIRIDGGEVLLQRLTVAGLTAQGQAQAIGAEATRECSAVALQAEDIRGAGATGLAMRLHAADARLTLLDLTAAGIEARQASAAGVGVLAMTQGAAELRGVSATEVLAGMAIGVLLGVGKGLDWLGGEIIDVRGRDAGAAGVRVLAAESDQSLAIADIRIEAIRGLPIGDHDRPDTRWGAWWRDNLRVVRLPTGLPDGAESPEPGVSALHVDAYVQETAHWAEHDPGSLTVQDCILRRISGVALQISNGLRDLELRRCEAWTSLRGGWLDGDRLLLAQLTWHRHLRGLRFGAGAFTLADCLVTGILEGVGIEMDADSDLDQVLACYVDGAIEYFDAAPDPLPYREPGPLTIPASLSNGALAPQARVDLRLRAGHGLSAEPVPGDDPLAPLFVGAHEPDAERGCDLRDPQPRADTIETPRPQPSPVVDYRARDARGLLTLMFDRAQVTMPQWQDRNAADQMTVLMELLAHELDHLAYRQEVAVSEGYLSTALSRRSLEDHARLVDYRPDPGLSATTLVRFDIDAEGEAALELGQGASLEIPADTLVVNPDASEISLVFATEAALLYDSLLREMQLHGAVEKGAVSADLAGALIRQGHGVRADETRIQPGRWLVLVPPESDAPRHVVQVVRVELGADTTRVFWDPRRPSPAGFPVDGSRVYGNVIPAHHGVPLAPLSDHLLPGALYETVDFMRPWREEMTLQLDNADRSLREVALPLDPVSVQTPGWPFPGETQRAGEPRLRVWVNDEEWKRVDQLALCGDEECFVLRGGRGGGAALRFGDGVNGALLPQGSVSIKLNLGVGLGPQGNVGLGALSHLLGFGEGGDIDRVLPHRADRDLLIRRHLKVGNVVPGSGGRDPESIAHIRYQAPLQVRDSLSAVALRDFKELLEAMPEVAAARAVLVDAGIRRVVRVTVLLHDEDTLVQAALGAQSEAERMRRWAAVRHRLESIRLLGYDVELLPPVFVQLDLDLSVDVEPWASAAAVRMAVEEALGGDGGLLDPDSRGLGRDVQMDRLHQCVLAVNGVAAVRVRRLRRLRPDAEEYASQGRLPIGPDEVAVLRHPYGGQQDGLVTVEVCGGIA